MLRRQAKHKILNIVHRGFIYACMGVTLLGCSMMGYRAFNYFFYVRPSAKLIEAEEKSKLLSEGKDNLLDAAPDLKS